LSLALIHFGFILVDSSNPEPSSGFRRFTFQSKFRRDSITFESISSEDRETEHDKGT